MIKREMERMLSPTRDDSLDAKEIWDSSFLTRIKPLKYLVRDRESWVKDYLFTVEKEMHVAEGVLMSILKGMPREERKRIKKDFTFQYLIDLVRKRKALIKAYEEMEEQDGF